MKFIKLQYHNEIKKILLKKEDLSYEELYNMILNSFFKKKDSLKLIIKYKDLENQEIAINNNQELGLALNLFYFQKFIKFIVYSSSIAYYFLKFIDFIRNFRKSRSTKRKN